MPKERTATVVAGEGATVRATKKAQEKYGPGWTVSGIISSTTGTHYVYRVVRGG